MLAFIARFGAGQSFPELMGNLLDLVDEHTEYFKSHLEALPPQERRVYLALARLWKPSTTREVADLARVDTNKCSSMLGRLARRGAVAIEGGTVRRKEYYLTERLYNIYYLLRRGGGEDRLVQALIDFMICLYSPSELLTFTKGLYEATRTLDVSLHGAHVQMTIALVKEALTLRQLGRTKEALDVYDQLIKLSYSEGVSSIESIVAITLMKESILLIETDRDDESFAICSELVNRFETRSEPKFHLLIAVAYYVKGIVLYKRNNSYDALDAYDQALGYLGETSENWISKFLRAGMIYCKG